MRKEKLFWIISDLICFLCFAPLFFFTFSLLSSDLMPNLAINFVFNLPFYISSGSICSILFALLISKFIRNKDEKYYGRLGIIFMGGSLLNLAIITLFVAFMFKGNLLHDGPVVYYPLACLVMCVIGFVFALVVFLMRKTFSRFKWDLSFKHQRGDLLLYILFFLLATWFAADTIIGFVSFDLERNILPIILTLLLINLPILMVVFYTYIYKDNDEEKQKTLRLRHGMYFTGLGLILFIGILICEFVVPNFMVESGQILFPLSFLAGIPIYLFILILACLVLPFVNALIIIIKNSRRKK